MVETPGPGHLRPLDPALDVFHFLIYALVSAIKHFLESIEFTFLYARCMLCFNQLLKKRYLKTSFFPYPINFFKPIIAFLIYCMFCILFKNLFPVLMHKVLQKILREFLVLLAKI